MDTMKKQQVIEKAKKIYKEIAVDDRRLAEDFMSIRAGLPKFNAEQNKKNHK